MSFIDTPIGQSKRLDRQTFLGKPSAAPRPPSPKQLIPTSFASGSVCCIIETLIQD
jgi:hypothetical protein